MVNKTTKTIFYKSKEGLFKNINRQLTFNELVNKRFNHKIKGWVNFNLPNEEYLNILNMFREYLNFKVPNYTGNEHTLVLSHNLRFLKSYGIFDRLWLQESYNTKNKYYVTYCAGQDGNAEIRLIKKLLKGVCE